MRAFLCFAVVMFFVSAANCQEGKILVAPFPVMDESGARSVDGEDLRRRFIYELGTHYFAGLIDFAKGGAGEIVSVIDAAAYCNRNGARYVLYGYVKRAENNTRAEIKLFSADANKIEKVFFGMDESSQEKRLMREVADHIAEYFYEKTGIDRDGAEPVDKKLLCGLFISAGWWTHYEKVLHERIVPVIDCGLGVDLKSGSLEKIVGGKSVALWFRFEADFKYSRGDENYYASKYYGIRVSAPLVLRIGFDKHNSMCFGIGPGYEFNVFDFQKKYEETERYYANIISLLMSLEYMCDIGEHFAVMAGVEIAAISSDDIGKWVRLKIGLEYTF